MKNFIPAASLALASVQGVQELGLTEEQPDFLQLNQQVGNGFCQVFAGWDFFDLKSFDALGRDAAKGAPAVIEAEKGTFFYKVCQPDWPLAAEDLALAKATEALKEVPASCKDMGAGDAFMMVGGECKYAFNSGSVFSGIAGETSPSGDIDYVGFKLEMTSTTACGDGNYVVTINAQCDATAGEFTVSEQTDCSLTSSYKGPEACKLYTFELGKQLNKIKPYFGGAFILFGLGMTFAGAKLLFQIFGGLVFLLTTSGLFMIIYNFFLPVSSSGYVVAGVAVFAASIGVGMAIFTYKFAKEWAVTLLAAWGGIIAAMIIVNIAGITNATASIALAVLGAIGAGYIGKQMNKLVRTAGTAFVGAGLVVKGVSMILGLQATNEFKQNDPVVWGLLGGLIVLSITGTLVQLYIFRDEGKSDDDFMNAEDEGRTCGCF